MSLPSIVLAIFSTTLFLVIRQSIDAEGGKSPCGAYAPCDVSVYGGWPKYGPNFMTFRIGLTLMALLLMPMIYARLRGELSCCICAIYAFASLAMISLLVMAYVPFWASPIHFIGAAFTFLFLTIAQFIDASLSDGKCACCTGSGAECALKILRFSVATLTIVSFASWMVSPIFTESGMPVSSLEYVAVFMPFVYFLTWTLEEALCPTRSKAHAFSREERSSLLHSRDAEARDPPDP